VKTFWKCVALLLSGACSAPAGPKLVRGAPGWKVELIAEAPALIDPTVVCCSPDGRIFLGSDPADMAQPAWSASDSVVCICPDGQILTFATNLHAVFGLQYIDGKLYVHHSPRFSVFEDRHGIGAHRVDLIVSDNLHPWLPSINDHIPSGCRLGMDGFLYITTGDKGVYGAIGTDGRKLEIHGGGVYRMRPDGSGLEVYCTGTRNHLDVAINSEDEMFTYDNTDDGAGWWTRVTHMVDGGYYGYPYDYKPRRPYTLWMMADYGDGAPTGACAYDEDALPDEYHGNLFLCDWGRQQVLRLKVQRDGASYTVVSRVQEQNLDFLTLGDAADFRPIGITVTPDGKGFYVADWGEATWKHTNLIGRLYKVTYTGKTQETPKPVWYVPAATGQKFQASTGELLAGLSHPAESVRLVAQRRLAERGDEAVRPLAALLKDPHAPSYARWSAIWSLDAIDAGKKARQAILAALSDPDVTVQTQAARQLGTRRAPEAVRPLAALLQSTNAAVRLHAATALGRIGDAAAVPALLTALEQKDLFARYAAFTALHRIGLANGKAWPAIVDGLASDKPAVGEGVLFATRETYDARLVEALVASTVKHNSDASVKTTLFGLLSSLYQQPPPWDGDWWRTKPVENPPPAKSSNWAGTPIVAAAMRSALREPENAVRRIGIDWIRSSHDTNAAAALALLYEQDTNVSMRREMVRAFGVTPTPAGDAIVRSILHDPRAPRPLLAMAVEAAGKIPDNAWNQELLQLAGDCTNDQLLRQLARILGEKRMSEAVPLLGKFAAKTNLDLRLAAVAALQKIGSQAAADQLLTLLDSRVAEIRSQAISALGTIKAKGAVPRLLSAAADAETHDVSVTALTQILDLSALDIYVDGLDSKNAVLRFQCEGAVRVLRQKALPLIESELATNHLSFQTLASLRHIYQNDPNAANSPLFRHKVLEIRPEEYRDFALSHHGNPRHGRRHFRDLKGPGCIRCHQILGEGGQIGPDLTGIRSKYKHADIIESVLYPSKRILDGYQQVFFAIQGEDEVSGIVRTENAEQVTIIDGSGATRVLEKSRITSRRISPVSLMPEGLQTALSPAEFSDLIAYVENPYMPPPGADPGPLSRPLPDRYLPVAAPKIAPAPTLETPGDPPSSDDDNLLALPRGPSDGSPPSVPPP
jgi:putative membrane-bound dehydrogenase-like protein